MKDKISSKRNDKDLYYFNEALEYYSRFDKSDFIFDQEINHLNPNQLRDDMINELNNLREIISNHPDLKYQNLPEDQKQCFNEFVKTYSTCPLCGEYLHFFNLKKVFFDEKKRIIKDNLIKIMNSKIKNFKKFSLNIGIPCCKCYKEIFENKK